MDHMFQTRRIKQEKRAKNHFDKVVYLHRQNKVLSNLAGNLSNYQ